MNERIDLLTLADCLSSIDQGLELWQNVDVVEQVPEAATNLITVLQSRVLCTLSWRQTWPVMSTTSAGEGVPAECHQLPPRWCVVIALCALFAIYSTEVGVRLECRSVFRKAAVTPDLRKFIGEAPSQSALAMKALSDLPTPEDVKTVSRGPVDFRHAFCTEKSPQKGHQGHRESRIFRRRHQHFHFQIRGLSTTRITPCVARWVAHICCPQASRGNCSHAKGRVCLEPGFFAVRLLWRDKPTPSKTNSPSWSFTSNPSRRKA